MTDADDQTQQIPDDSDKIKTRESIIAECHKSGQTITAKGKEHAYSDAIGYKYTLRAGSGTGKVLSIKRSKKGVRFTDLNVGETYCVQIQEFSSVYEYSDTQVFFRRTPVKAAYRKYYSRKKLGKYLEKKAIKRARTIIVCFARRKMDTWDIVKDRPLFALPYSYLAAVYRDQYRSRNKYNEAIRINGKKYYKYRFRFTSYQYSKTQQRKYIRKIDSLKRSLKGSSAKKTRALSKYIRNKVRYDWGEYHKWKSGKYTDTSTSAYSAYAALVKKRAVCQGISEAAAIVLDWAGVKCECVGGTNLRTGNGHAWNIVRSGNKWYWCDFCNSIWGYNEILIGSKAFGKTHRLDKKAYAEQMKRVGRIA